VIAVAVIALLIGVAAGAALSECRHRNGLRTARPQMSPVEFYQQAQRTRATAWQKVDR